MENYIMLKGRKVGLTDEQAKGVEQLLSLTNERLGDVPTGETRCIGGFDFVILEHLENGTAVILKDLYHEREQFGKNDNFKGSHAETLCMEFAEKLGNTIGEDNVILHTVDLTSDDGLKDYGSTEARASLLTANQYRKYVEILDKHKFNKWWWLATAYSTPTHDDDKWIKCVTPSGSINGDYYCVSCGVRPFCILNSDIFVSKVY